MNTQERNELMHKARWEDGEAVPAIAGRFGVSESHAYRITAKADTSIPAELQPRDLFREFGTSGLSRWSGRQSSILEDGLREMQDLQSRIAIFNEMANNHPVVQAVLFALEWTLREVDFFAEPASDDGENVRKAEFLEECMDDMSYSWQDTLSMIMTVFQHGFFPMELVYKRRLGPEPGMDEDGRPLPTSKFDDGLIGWRKWGPRPADTLAPGQEWMFDDAGGIRGIRQQTRPDWQVREIPVEKLVLFRTTIAPKANPEAKSLLRPMYTSWYYASELASVEAIGAERDLAGLPVMYLGKGTILQGDSNDFDLSQEIVRNIRRDEQEGIVIPFPKMTENTDGVGMLLELLSTGGQRQFDVGEIISRYEKRMAMTVLAQWIFLGMERVGTQALATVTGDFFTLALDGWAKSITDTINRYAVPRLFRLNGWPAQELPRWRHSRVGSPDLLALADYVNKLVDKQVLTPDIELERHLREIARFPGPPEEMERAPATLTADTGIGGSALTNEDARDLSLLLQRQQNTAQSLLEAGQIDLVTADAMIAPILEEMRVRGIIGKSYRVPWQTSKQERELFVPAEGDMAIDIMDEAQVTEADVDAAVRRFKEWAQKHDPDLANLLEAEVETDAE